MASKPPGVSTTGGVDENHYQPIVLTPAVSTCRSCGRQKPIHEFALHPKTRNGHDHRCKECVRQYQRNRRAALRSARQDRSACSSNQLPSAS